MTFIRRVPQIVVITCVCCCSSAAELPVDDKLSADDVYSIRFRSLNVPVERIFLLRNRNEFCALKLGAYGTAVIDGKNVQYANYELLRTPIEQLSLKAGNIETGRLEFKGYTGLGHWVWERGNTVLKCGGQRIGWSYPNELGLVGDAGFAVAPTAWTSFAQVRVDDAQLHWFSEDKTQKRGEMKIPVRSLPGFVPRIGSKP